MQSIAQVVEKSYLYLIYPMSRRYDFVDVRGA